MKQLIESVTDFGGNETAAREALVGIRGLEDCLAARVMPPKYLQHGWAVQAFFPDAADPLPDGCNRRHVPEGFLAGKDFQA